MSVDDFERFIVGASTVDPNPLREAEERIAPLVDEGSEIRIVTRHPKEDRDLALEMEISQGRAVLSYGLRNFPDGEVFTSPDASSVEGEIFVDLPVNYGGNDIQGIYLKFDGGRIVEYRADEGHEHLTTIIETDDGLAPARRGGLGDEPGSRSGAQTPALCREGRRHPAHRHRRQL